MRREDFNSVLSSWKGSFPETGFLQFCLGVLAKGCEPRAQSCLECQRSKMQNHVKSPIQHIPVPGRRFFHIHVDLVGPLPQSNGFFHLFTIINRSTRWPEAIPLCSTTVEDCERALLRSWIPLFGIPSVITSD